MTDTAPVPITAAPIEAPAADVPATSAPQRDARGHFLPGNRLSPGRKPRIDFRAVAQERAEKEGIDLRDALWDVFSAQLTRAKGGATDAARFVFDLLAIQDDVAQGAMALTVITGVDSTGAPATGIGLRLASTQEDA